VDHSEGSRIGPGLHSVSPVDCIFLLEAANDRVCPEGGGIHGGIEGRLEMLMVVAKGIEEKDNFDLVEVNRSHVGNSCVHGKNLIGAITEGSIAAIVEIKSLLKEKELSMCAEFLMALLELLVDEMQSGEM